MEFLELTRARFTGNPHQKAITFDVDVALNIKRTLRLPIDTLRSLDYTPTLTGSVFGAHYPIANGVTTFDFDRGRWNVGVQIHWVPGKTYFMLDNQKK